MASAVSDLFRRITSFKMGKSQLDGSSEVSGQLNKSENMLIGMHKILMWDDPFLSSLCIVFVNIVFWLIIYLELKFYGIIFISLLLIFLGQLFTAHLSSNSQDKSFTWNLLGKSNNVVFNPFEINCCVKKGQEMIKNAYVKAKIFRRTQPGMFCILTCFCFLFLSVIGRSISGIMLIYILIMLILTVPGAIINFLPPHTISSITNFIYSSQKENDNSNDDEVEPYLPETSKEDLELLRLAGELQLPLKEEEEEISDLLLERISARTNDTTGTESVSSKLSFYPESSFMPSPENSIDFLDLDLPSSGRTEQESENNDINFQSQHFDEDSSEEEFAQGLNLTQKPKGKPKTEDTKTDSSILPSTLNTGNLISLGTNLLTAVVKQKAAAKSDRESSSDTDSFEMISEEDM